MSISKIANNIKPVGNSFPPVHQWNPDLCEGQEFFINRDGDWFYDFNESNIPEMPSILVEACNQIRIKRASRNILAHKVENALGVRVTEEGIEELKKIFNE